LGVGRFLENIAHAPANTSLRFAAEPGAAAAELCGP
jgi:hypothetical protein